VIEIHLEEKYYYQACPLKDNQKIEKSKTFYIKLNSFLEKRILHLRMVVVVVVVVVEEEELDRNRLLFVVVVVVAAAVVVDTLVLMNQY
jgi:hypothetical protein